MGICLYILNKIGLNIIFIELKIDLDFKLTYLYILFKFIGLYIIAFIFSFFLIYYKIVNLIILYTKQY